MPKCQPPRDYEPGGFALCFACSSGSGALKHPRRCCPLLFAPTHRLHRQVEKIVFISNHTVCSKIDVMGKLTEENGTGG